MQSVRCSVNASASQANTKCRGLRGHALNGRSSLTYVTLYLMMQGYIFGNPKACSFILLMEFAILSKNQSAYYERLPLRKASSSCNMQSLRCSVYASASRANTKCLGLCGHALNGWSSLSYVKLYSPRRCEAKKPTTTRTVVAFCSTLNDSLLFLLRQKTKVNEKIAVA